jgi:hypothetical protein
MKSVIDSLDSVSEPLREHYELRSGKYHLKLDDQPSGYVKAEDLLKANDKIVEFRDNNIKYLKELDELRPLKTKFDGLDPEEAREAVKKVKELGKKGVKDAEDLDARLKAMVDEAVKPLKEQLGDSEKARAAERQRANDFLLHSKISEAFTKIGGKPNAADFVVGLAKDIFEVGENGVAAKTGKFSKEKPGDPISIEEWLTKNVQIEHDYVFQPSNGGGALNVNKGGGNGTTRTAPKAGQTIIKDPTPQQLGEYSKDVVDGKVVFEFTETTQ